MRISDWSSDVCSSDLSTARPATTRPTRCVRRAWPSPAFPGSLSTIAEDRAGRAGSGVQRRRKRAVGGVDLRRDRRHCGPCADEGMPGGVRRPEENTAELQSLKRTSYAVLCLKNKKAPNSHIH